MKTVNISDTDLVGSAAMQNGDFLTFDALPVNKFSLIFPSQPNVNFFVQQFTLPAIKINQVTVATRFVDYNEVGEKLQYEPFSLTFLVDKYSRNWASIFNWMKEITVDGSNVGRTDDIVLMVDGKEFIRFYGAWPTSLSGYELDSTIEKLTYVKANLTLNYDYLEYIGNFKTIDSAYK